MTRPLSSVLAHLKSSGFHLGAEPQPRPERGSSAEPFVTIARQAGAGGVQLANRLAQRLNTALRTGEDYRWRAYDRELVEAVAEDHHLSGYLIDSLSERDQGWLAQTLSALDFDRPGDLRVFRCTLATIRTLAQAGRTVLVGRGGVFMTRDLPGGVHVWLVAPEEQRLARFAEQYGLTAAQASSRLREIDRARRSFLKRYFPGQAYAPDTFDLVLNCATLSEEEMAGAVAALLSPSSLRRAVA